MKGCRSSILLFLFWTLLVLCSLVPLKVNIEQIIDQVSILYNLYFILCCGSNVCGRFKIWCGTPPFRCVRCSGAQYTLLYYRLEPECRIEVRRTWWDPRKGLKSVAGLWWSHTELVHEHPNSSLFQLLAVVLVSGVALSRGPGLWCSS